MEVSVLPLAIAMREGDGAATALTADSVSNSIMAWGTILIHYVSHLSLGFRPNSANRRLLKGAVGMLGAYNQSLKKTIELGLSATEFLDRVMALGPPAHKHQHRYFGGLVPNAP